eukprot:symbB.v1.2.011138.t1/scaffold732.1/size241626/12
MRSLHFIVAALLWQSSSALEGLVDITRMIELELDGALCDPSRLEEIDCDNTVWRRLLGLVCQHCTGGCVSNFELAEAAHWVIQLYTSMHDQGQDLETFSCKHGLVAALLFHSEHVPLDFRRPSTEVEVLTPPATVNLELSLEEMETEPAEKKLKSAGVPLTLVNYSLLEVTDSQGFRVRVQTDENGDRTLESDRDPTDGGFPLHVRYQVPEVKREFFDLKRFLAVNEVESQGESYVATLHMRIPVMSLAPFPFHTAKLRSLRQINQEEYDTLVYNISRTFSSAGITHVVVDNDYTLRFWDTEVDHSNEKSYLQTRFGLDQMSKHPGQMLQRLSFFVPLEQRHAVQLLATKNRHSSSERYRLVDLEPGHVQYGEMPFEFASGLNFRMMCSECLWVSIYFYVTEAIGSLLRTGPGMTVLPLAFWVPCRIPAEELFPVRSWPLGPGTVPRPPAPGVQMAEERWQQQQGEDPLFAAVQHHYSIRNLESRRRSIYHGRCRESLLRLVPSSYHGAVPELLPMHDMSDVMKMGMRSTLELMMGFRQVYKAAGLEHYQDKIQLSKDQRKLLIYTENDRGMKPHSVCSYCPAYTESYFRPSVGGSTSLPAVAVTARTFNNVVSAFPKSFSPLMTRILTCDPPFVILNLRGDLMWRKPLTFAVHKVSL